MYRKFKNYKRSTISYQRKEDSSYQEKLLNEAKRQLMHKIEI